MSPRGAFFVGASLLTAMGLLALLRAATGTVVAARPLDVPPAARVRSEQPREYAPHTLVPTIVARDLFRSSRRAAAVPYDPVRAAEIETPQSAPAKATLVLVGVIAGREPTAVIEGFPGTEGARVVRAGDVVAGLRVTTITPERVRIIGMDTTWVLKVREPWK